MESEWMSSSRPSTCARPTCILTSCAGGICIITGTPPGPMVTTRTSPFIDTTLGYPRDGEAATVG